MSDASIPICEECDRLVYECICGEGLCADCGCKLGKDAIDAGRDMCFACYCDQQD